ncbi:hypothetical protein TNCT_96711 [Trichonephila clavata]|uniref:Uncharacterized protein n=1 Tax=Trichonephila clavata TaxID=2740835 RepID=A0A8X6KG08_TRICU|nr:hypothetical protein TNCT_96711 [Trichonephila clavata]
MLLIVTFGSSRINSFICYSVDFVANKTVDGCFQSSTTVLERPCEHFFILLYTTFVINISLLKEVTFLYKYLFYSSPFTPKIRPLHASSLPNFATCRYKGGHKILVLLWPECLLINRLIKFPNGDGGIPCQTAEKKKSQDSAIVAVTYTKRPKSSMGERSCDIAGQR